MNAVRVFLLLCLGVLCQCDNPVFTYKPKAAFGDVDPALKGGKRWSKHYMYFDRWLKPVFHACFIIDPPKSEHDSTNLFETVDFFKYFTSAYKSIKTDQQYLFLIEHELGEYFLNFTVTKPHERILEFYINGELRNAYSFEEFSKTSVIFRLLLSPSIKDNLRYNFEGFETGITKWKILEFEGKKCVPVKTKVVQGGTTAAWDLERMLLRTTLYGERIFQVPKLTTTPKPTTSTTPIPTTTATATTTATEPVTTATNKVPTKFYIICVVIVVVDVLAFTALNVACFWVGKERRKFKTAEAAAKRKKARASTDPVVRAPKKSESRVTVDSVPKKTKTKSTKKTTAPKKAPLGVPKEKKTNVKSNKPASAKSEVESASSPMPATEKSELATSYVTSIGSKTPTEPSRPRKKFKNITTPVFY